VLGAFIDAATSRLALDVLIRLALLFLAASLVQQVLLVGAAFFSERVGWTATNALRADLALHLLRLDPDFHTAHTPGELTERVDGDVTNIASFFSQFVLQVVGNILLLAGVLVVLWALDWRVGVVLSLYAAAALATMIRIRALSIPFWTAFREASARLFGFVEERLAGLEDIRSSGAGNHTLDRLVVHTDERLRTGRRARLISSIPYSLPIVSSTIGTALAFGLAAVLVVAGTLTLGAAFTIYYYTRLLFQPLSRISSQLEEFQRANAGIVRIQQVRQFRSSLQDPPTPRRLTGGSLSAELDHVDFAYRAGEPVLQDLSIVVPPGATLGIVGRTGSGKTTVGRLLIRLWDPQAGVVRVGGLDVRDIHRTELRQRIGLVSQDPQLFRATVADNLTIFDASISQARLMAALDELGLSEWIAELPLQLDTRLCADGRGLSAGESQLLALARVFLRDPGLVILDEPSSRLDPPTQRLVDSAIRRLLRDRTGIIISHRQETVAGCDAILSLKARQAVVA
jgi:ATP-binding cassette, subfamily B, bacterial